ncbi:uncharacterized protein LOC100679738 isoform X1 [Nasonia vitripennis]|uniref:Uncharacterized protein n=1 Tax=Nasonia vitripennis TaxID=7425 RepID=A0A7M7H5J8_NASVI|nr:uncharacterized protein LOC100679738 isoform X1 [Nasonia vitripennis]
MRKMTIYQHLIVCLLFLCFMAVDSVPIEYIEVDQDPWQKMVVRQFFVPFYVVPEENRPLYQNNYYNQQHRPSIFEYPAVESSTRDKKGISDFGASYGFYPVGLAIFSNGVRSNLENVDNSDIENLDAKIGHVNV